MGILSFFRRKENDTGKQRTAYDHAKELTANAKEDETSVIRRIISESAKRELEPRGLFRKGNSRLWVDDNEWFVILVEYQASSWTKGSFLNVAIHFFWTFSDALSFDFGGRQKELVSCNGRVEKFVQGVDDLTATAVEKVREYRRFREVTYAFKRVTQYAPQEDDFHGLYHRLMISGLAGCTEEAKLYFERLMLIEKQGSASWQRPYFRELHETVEPMLEKPEAFTAYVREKIRVGRERLASQPGFEPLQGE